MLVRQTYYLHKIQKKTMRQLKISKSITNRDASLDKYLQEISREQQITVDEEVELAQRIRPRVTRC